MIAVVILAAGASRRLGRPKQLELLGQETLLGRAIRVASEARLGAVYVVVDPADVAVTAEAQRLPCQLVFNPEAKEGMASSLRAGIDAVPDTVSAVVVMACDQPAVTPEHLQALAAAGENRDIVVASAYSNRRGVPAFFPQAFFSALAALDGDAGARDLLRDAHAIPLGGGERDIDTPEELEEARIAFAPGPQRS